MSEAVLIRSVQLFESTSASMTGYRSHIEGLKHLLAMRGPDRCRYGSPLERAILEETRLKAASHSHDPDQEQG